MPDRPAGGGSRATTRRGGLGAEERLAERLTVVRRRAFVGRGAELELFRQALSAEDPPFAVLYLFGPGGVGKTTLLGEFRRIAGEAALHVYHLDGREVDPSPQRFLLALARAIDPDRPQRSLRDLADLPRAVIVLDTYERLAALDDWVREAFLPALPPHVLVVMAARQPPSSPWMVDPAWRDRARVVSLRNLRPEESRELLSKLGVPRRAQASIVDVTHGHPLALVLLADWLALDPAWSPEDLPRTPDVVRQLAERFVRDAPTPAHRRALEVCAHVRVTTEALLAAVLGRDRAYDVFRWLQGLSFIEVGPEGLFPHELVREVLEAELRWRNPDAYREMHRQVRSYLRRRHEESGGAEQQRAFIDLLYLHRNPAMRAGYDWKAAAEAYIEPAGPDDRRAILRMVERHEGKGSAARAAYWLERQPEAFEVFRAPGRPVVGFAAHLFLRTVTDRDERRDPAVAGIWCYARSRGPLRPGEGILVTRYWMGWEAYQDTFVHTLVATGAVRRWLTTPALAWSFACMADPERWERMFAYLEFHAVPEASFTQGDRSIGVFGHDWRVQPQTLWLDVLAERELREEIEPGRTPAPATQELLVLSQPGFADAVRQALRDYSRPDALATNPLLRSRLLVEPGRPSPTAADLRGLLERAVETLRGDPRDEKLYRALDATYLHPAPSQEAAAELLGLPFSTYRYHLAKGIQRVTDLLWRRELYGPDP
ncbi:MAG: hypothetical protein KatS3mg014_0621 [Actinomycetota bacterium]|nr:MAG: hypothetical protein KatS3mg014_0621 [Actinomycetota bacterium]